MTSVPPGAIATIGGRFTARAIDAVVVGGPFLALVLWQSTIDIDNRVFHTPAWITWLGLAVGFTYDVVAVATRGQTIGKAVMRIRVVEVGTARTPTVRQAALRAAPALVGRVPVVGQLVAATYWLPLLWRADRRGFHDLAAGTMVIKADY